MGSKCRAGWKHREKIRMPEWSRIANIKNIWKDAHLPGACTYCGRPVTRTGKGGNRVGTLDHRTPLARGGPDTEDNWAIACTQCNHAKGDSTEEQFRAVLAHQKGKK